MGFFVFGALLDPFQVGLSLEQYETETTIQGTPQNIPLALLDRVEHTKDLEKTVHEHVLPCCHFLGLDIDHLLSKYVVSAQCCSSTNTFCPVQGT